MSALPSWFPADYDALLAGLARKAEGLEARLTCWPMIAHPATALSPQDHLGWAMVVSAAIDELFEPLGMITYRRDTGEQFFAALLIALEGMARRRPDAAELASEVASGSLQTWAALAWLDEPPRRPAAERTTAEVDPAALEEIVAAIERAQREIEAMPSLLAPEKVRAGASSAISVARERLVEARAADVDPTLLASCPQFPTLRSAGLRLPVPPNAQQAGRLSTVAENVEVAFAVAPTPARLRALYLYWSARDRWAVVEDEPGRLVLERGQQRVELTMVQETECTRLGARIRTRSPVEYG